MKRRPAARESLRALKNDKCADVRSWGEDRMGSASPTCLGASLTSGRQPAHPCAAVCQAANRIWRKRRREEFICALRMLVTGLSQEKQSSQDEVASGPMSCDLARKEGRSSSVMSIAYSPKSVIHSRFSAACHKRLTLLFIKDTLTRRK